MNKPTKRSFCILPLLGAAVLASCNTAGPSTPVLNDNSTCRVEAIMTSLLEIHDDGVLVAAHRGHHVAVPENSIPSIKSAIEIGADIVELDVMLTKDGVPVLMHDETVDRTTNGSGRVKDMTLSEIKSLRLTMPDGSLSQELVPTLAEALEVARGQIVIDHDLKPADIEPTIEVILRAEMLEQVMFYNAELSVRDEILKIAPEAVVMPIARSEEDVERILATTDIEVLHVLETFNNPEIAAVLDAKEIAGWTNALGDADALARSGKVYEAFTPIVSNRPDIVQTDLPEELLAFLISEGLRTKPSVEHCAP